MAGSVNKVILVGNLGANPEIRHTQQGKKMATLSIATNEAWRDSSGERRDKTEWHRVVIFSEGLASIAEKYLKKGSKIYLEGQLQTRKWQGNDGQDRYSTEVVLQGFNGVLTMLDSRGGGDFDRGDNFEGPVPSDGDLGWEGGQRVESPKPHIDDLDDEIPF